MKNLVSRILDGTNEFKKSGFNMDDIDMPDDDSLTNEKIESISPFCPADKEALKKWILEQLIIQGPNANLNNVDLSKLTDLSFAFSRRKNDMAIDKVYGFRTKDRVYGSLGNFFTDKEIYKLREKINKAWRIIWRNDNKFNLTLNSEFRIYNIFYYMNPDISDWDVSNINDMHCMFYGDDFNFNCNLDKWDVSNVINMHSMFKYCFQFNKPLNNWHVDNVKNMKYMFYSCNYFNQPLDNWHVDSVQNMDSMFGNSGFHQDISNWNINPSTCTDDMFIYCLIDNKCKPKALQQ